MTKTLTSLALGALLLASLTACAFGGGTVEPTAQPTVAPETTDDGPVSGGGFTNGDCEGKDVVIDTENTNAVLEGECGAVTVTADRVFLTLENAESISVTGSRVDVVVEGSVGAVSMGGEQNSYTGGDVASLAVSGSTVNVTVNEAGSVSVSGSSNFVVWTSGAASATDSGSENTVLAP